MNTTPKMFFHVAKSIQAVPFDVHTCYVRIQRVSDNVFEYTLKGTTTQSAMSMEWLVQGNYARDDDIPDGEYTASIYMEDSVGLKSNSVTLNFLINRNPILPVITKTQQLFTPINHNDNIADTISQNIVLLDGGITVNALYTYTIYSPYNDIVIKKTNYSASVIEWDGKDSTGNYVVDGLYVLKVVTVDDIGNQAEEVNSVIDNKIPLKLLSPKAIVSGINMVPIIATVLDPGGSSFMDFDRFELFTCSGIVTPGQLVTSENLYTSLNANIWSPISPLPFYMDPSAVDFPLSMYGVKNAFSTKVAFWQPSQNGVYSVLLRANDKEGFSAAVVQTVSVNLTYQPIDVIKITPQDDITLNITNIFFNCATKWDAHDFAGLVGCEVNIYSISSDNHKEKIIRNYSKSGLNGQAPLVINWDGKDQWQNYVKSGQYIVQIYFYSCS